MRKRKEFFDEKKNKVIDRNGKAWSHRKLAILYDLLGLDGKGVWDSEHENFALDYIKDADPTGLIFIDQETLYRGYTYLHRQSEIKLSPDWKQTLMDKYGVTVIESIPITSEENA